MGEDNINLSKDRVQNMNNYSNQTNEALQQNYNNNEFIQNNNVKNNHTTWLIIGIIQLLCCNQITGIITLMFSFSADEAYKKGNINSYKLNIKYAKITTIIGIVVGVIVGILYLVLLIDFGLDIISRLCYN